eukprot:TRINITY_DN5285_c0_g1_i1.p1 TRINITY_DN5285_c0_g1~~TRINITY_DN5285_c0_g1_i1.p1  ORF type:complete len:1325 (-),score=85.31 TRINITY_DN5285_c0_g1_i1:1897-5871(-)
MKQPLLSFITTSFAAAIIAIIAGWKHTQVPNCTSSSRRPLMISARRRFTPPYGTLALHHLLVMTGNLTWPRPTSSAAWAAANFDRIHSVFPSPNAVGAQKVADWAWERVETNDTASLSLALAHTAETLVPANSLFGTRSHAIESITGHLLVTMAICRLRLATRTRSPPPWARRVFFALPRIVQKAVALPSPNAWERQLRTWLSQPDKSMTANYILFSHSDWYIGKTNLHRKDGGCGLLARATEHLRATLTPKSAEGSLHRYTRFRKSIGSLAFLPITIFPSEPQALAVESFLIKFLSPRANRADTTQRRARTGVLLHPSRQKTRPPPRLRSRTIQSIWDFGLFQRALDQAASPPEPPPPHQRVKGSFSVVYRTLQRMWMAQSGLLGPLWIFASGAENLFLTYAAARLPYIFFPPRWRPPQIAQFIYDLVPRITTFVFGPASQLAAKKSLDFILWKHHLPPVSVPPLLVHPMWKARIAALRRSVRASVSKIRNEPARVWLLKNFRIQPSRSRLWRDSFRAKAAVEKFSASWFVKTKQEHVHKLLECNSLHALVGPWRLPMWPTAPKLRRELIANWNKWTTRTRVHTRVRHAGRAAVETITGKFTVPPPPKLWAKAETILEPATKNKSQILVGDDRDFSKAWSINADEMNVTLFKAIYEDPSTWQIRHDLNTDDITRWMHARSVLGLPGFLRRGQKSEVQPPRLFPLIKSKCYNNDGTKKCTRPRHSCWRRVVDMAKTPHKQGWRTMARAIRGIVENSGVGFEIFDMKNAAPRILATIESLDASRVSSCCHSCGKALRPGLHVTTLDIDQAFEACTASQVIPAWLRIAERYEAAHGSDRILVRRGRRHLTKAGKTGFGRGWWSISVEQATRALKAATHLTLVQFGDVVLEMAGLAIGGNLSSGAVAVRLADEENRTSPDDRRHIAWCRYVDDIIAFSYDTCCGCQTRFFQETFVESVSTCHQSDLEPDSIFDWLDLSLTVVGMRIRWTLKNQNREWVQKMLPGPPPHTNLIPWPGRLPRGFASYRGQLLGKIARCRQLSLDRPLLLFCILEHVLELFRCGYPYSVIRALIHSCYVTAEIRLARQSVRSWGDLLKKIGAMAYGNGGSGQKQGQQNNNNQTNKTRRRRRRKRSSSHSSDTSTSETSRKVSRAQKVLKKHSRHYREYLHKKEESARDAELRRQGEVLAQAMSSKFDIAIRNATNAASAFPPTPPIPSVLTPVAALPPAPVAPPVAPPIAPAAVAPIVIEPPNALTPMQRRLFEAELGHSIALEHGSFDHFREKIEESWHERNLSTRIQAIYRNYAGGQRMPRAKLDRINGLWEIFRRIS